MYTSHPPNVFRVETSTDIKVSLLKVLNMSTTQREQMRTECAEWFNANLTFAALAPRITSLLKQIGMS